MNRVDRLVAAYRQHILVPWRSDASAEERVIFCIYNETDELILRAKLSEFELDTQKSDHDWLMLDFSDTFAAWLTHQKYGKQYFEKPELLAPAIDGYSRWLNEWFEDSIRVRGENSNTVVALIGVAALFGFLKVRDVVSAYARLVNGRLVVFFPGSHENNNYRLLDAYDGWNYLAVPITADMKS